MSPNYVRGKLRAAALQEEGRWLGCDYGRHRVMVEFVEALAKDYLTPDNIPDIYLIAKLLTWRAK